MKKILPGLCVLLLTVQYLLAQEPAGLKNPEFLSFLNHDTSYLNERKKIINDFAKIPAGQWGEFIRGVDVDFMVKNKVIALTFDACGGLHGSGYDTAIIHYLKRENIPATIFVTGKWIDNNYSAFVELSRDTLFEIENHGLNHQPCAVNGESKYGIKGTPDVSSAFDEIEANERKIKSITGRRPLFYRSATAYIDEAGVQIARKLNVTTISYDVLSGDAVPYTPAIKIETNVLAHVKPGAIIIFHINHPEWYTYESLLKIIPELLKQGYSFARLAEYPLVEKYQYNTKVLQGSGVNTVN